MKLSYFKNISNNKIMKVSLAKGKALVRGCSVSEIPQRSEDNCGLCFLERR